jgi:methyltransferase (TIGR00027 family)
MVGQAAAVESGKASATAQRVAAHRLTFDRVAADFGDPRSDDRLARDVAASVSVDGTSPIARYLAARTRFFDRVVVDALERGISQVVVAAAGYDGRALRYAKSGVRWFELDHPDTQRDKRARLERLGIATPHITFVPADFYVDDVAAELERAGHRSSRASVITAEGVAVYLDHDVVVSLLRQLRAAAAPRSRLAISLSVDTDAPELEARRARFNAAVSAMGEPARTVLTADDAESLFATTGWRAVDRGDDDRSRRAGLVIAEPV